MGMPAEDSEDEADEQQFDRSSRILGQSLGQYESNKHGIPVILELLVNYFEENPLQIRTQGIFRKQAAVYEEKILEAACACKKNSFILKVQDAHIVCGVIKQFFLQLKEPIVPYEVYENIMSVSGHEWPDNEQQQDQYVKVVLDGLPA